ncbi:MAG: hypothetical protein Q7S86_02715 [bacterium]|nr:hypothetical protein [bacterium]
MQRKFSILSVLVAVVFVGMAISRFFTPEPLKVPVQEKTEVVATMNKNRHTVVQPPPPTQKGTLRVKLTLVN